MKGLTFTLLMFLIAIPYVRSQELGSWTALSKKDAEKVLNNSAWGQTQTDTDTSEMFFSPTRPGSSSIGKPETSKNPIGSQQSINNNRADQGATNQAISEFRRYLPRD